MQVKTSILPFSDIIVVQLLQVGYEKYHIIGHGSVPVRFPTCRLQRRVRQLADVLDRNSYDTYI